MKVKRYSVQRGTSEGADGERTDGIELTKELLKRCSAMHCYLTLLQRYAADNFATTHEQRQQLKKPAVFLEGSLEEEENVE